jgi:hypothetical protein
MKRQVRIVVTDSTQLTEKIIGYFIQFGFKLISNQNGSLKFRQSSTLLDAWKANPLKWGSDISVSISNNNILADFCVDTAAQMNTKEEKAVWQTFIENFQSYLTVGTTNYSKLNSKITESKRSRIICIGWAVFGALFGGSLSFVYTSLTDTTPTLSIFLIPRVASIFLAWRIKYIKTNNAL